MCCLENSQKEIVIFPSTWRKTTVLLWVVSLWWCHRLTMVVWSLYPHISELFHGHLDNHWPFSNPHFFQFDDPSADFAFDYIHWSQVDSRHKGSVMRKAFHVMTSPYDDNSRDTVSSKYFTRSFACYDKSMPTSGIKPLAPGVLNEISSK